jgi:hypothetical protein
MLVGVSELERALEQWSVTTGPGLLRWHLKWATAIRRLPLVGKCSSKTKLRAQGLGRGKSAHVQSVKPGWRGHTSSSSPQVAYLLARLGFTLPVGDDGHWQDTGTSLRGT